MIAVYQAGSLPRSHSDQMRSCHKGFSKANISHLGYSAPSKKYVAALYIKMRNLSSLSLIKLCLCIATTCICMWCPKWHIWVVVQDYDLSDKPFNWCLSNVAQQHGWTYAIRMEVVQPACCIERHLMAPVAWPKHNTGKASPVVIAVQLTPWA